jgi:hypothetical protein
MRRRHRPGESECAQVSEPCRRWHRPPGRPAAACAEGVTAGVNVYVTAPAGQCGQDVLDVLDMRSGQVTATGAAQAAGPGHRYHWGVWFERLRQAGALCRMMRRERAVTGTGQARRRGTTRLLALYAVLLGLFLMHGAPASAAEGCHGAMSAAASMPENHHTAEMTSTPPAAGVSATSSTALLSGAPHASTSAMDGTMCVSTPARDRVPLPMSGLVAVVAVLAAGFLGSRPLALGRTGRRGPPPLGGRNLLLQVCIART